MNFVSTDNPYAVLTLIAHVVYGGILGAFYSL